MDAGGRWVLGEHGPGRLSIDDTVGAPDSPPNLLIHAEAYAALASLGDRLGDERVRLCYIDPPYNTGQGFETYDDRAAHGVWLSCLEERVILARKLLHANGYFVAHVNIVEHAYLKVLLDEIFGRERLLSQISWQRAPDRTVLGQGGALVSDQVEYLLVYANDRVDPDWPRPQKQTALSAKTLQSYARVLQPSADAKLIDEFSDNRGSPVRVYQHEAFTMRTLPASTMRAAANQVNDKIISVFNDMTRLTNQQPESTFQQEILSRLPERDVLYRAEYTQTRGKHKGPRERHYLNGQVVLWLRDVAKIEQNRLVRVADLNNFWPADEIPATGIANEGGVVLRRGKKPERLMARVIEAFSRPGDWVLDFFAGSGTTGAVAEMLGRRWILVEAGSSAHKLCKPRLARAVGKTGGGFAVATVSPHIHNPVEK